MTKGDGRMKYATLKLAALTLLLGGVGQANAAFIHNSTGLSSPSQVITFEEHVLSEGTPVTNQYADLGVTFSNGLKYTGGYSGAFPHISGHSLVNFQPIISPFS